MRYLLKVSYDGSKFYGFQRQKDKNAVQNNIERELSKLFNKEILIKGAGRTDRGVHSFGQVVHFDSDLCVSPSLIKSDLNNSLKYIRIRKCKIVSSSFHSRFSAKKKHYMYKISFNKEDYNSEYKLFSKKVNIKEMKRASKEFLGVHNFQNFVSGTRENYMSIIYKIKFCKLGNNLTIHFYGKSFYRYMVRNMVGALLDIGKGKATISDLRNLLISEKTDKMLSTAPSKGLTLVKIYY